LTRYEIKFENICEIRMGSPFNGADVILSGDYIPDLSEHTFQDIGLINEAGDICYLVQWDQESGGPGFIVWKIDASKKCVTKSQKQTGCCKLLTLNDSLLVATIWNYEDVTGTELIDKSEIHFS